MISIQFPFRSPLHVLRSLTGDIDALEGEQALLDQSVYPGQGALQQPGNFDRSTISGSSGQTLVTSLVRGSHLVLPGTTVVPVSTKDDTGLPVNPNLLVESFVPHVHIQVRTSVVFSELDTLGVTLQNLLDQLGHGAGIGVSLLVVPSDPRVVCREPSLDAVLQDRLAVRAHLGVVLDVLTEPPCKTDRAISIMQMTNALQTSQLTRTVSAVVSRVAARVEQVGDETMLQGGTKGQDVVSSGSKVASSEEQTTKRDELIEGEISILYLSPGPVLPTTSRPQHRAQPAEK